MCANTIAIQASNKRPAEVNCQIQSQLKLSGAETYLAAGAPRAVAFSAPEEKKKRRVLSGTQSAAVPRHAIQPATQHFTI